MKAGLMLLRAGSLAVLGTGIAFTETNIHTPSFRRQREALVPLAESVRYGKSSSDTAVRLEAIRSDARRLWHSSEAGRWRFAMRRTPQFISDVYELEQDARRSSGGSLSIGFADRILYVSEAADQTDSSLGVFGPAFGILGLCGLASSFRKKVAEDIWSIHPNFR